MIGGPCGTHLSHVVSSSALVTFRGMPIPRISSWTALLLLIHVSLLGCAAGRVVDARAPANPLEKAPVQRPPDSGSERPVNVVSSASAARVAENDPLLTNWFVSINVLPFGAGMSRPEFVSGPRIFYTKEALEDRIEGLLIAKCTITYEGDVTNCRLLKNLPHMGEAVLLVLEQQRYKPVTINGKPVSVDYTFNIRLSLPGGELLADKIQSSVSKAVVREELEPRQKAVWLCQFDMFEAPVVARMPKNVDPSFYIRRQDLDFLQKDSSQASLLEPERPEWRDARALNDLCEVTEVVKSKDLAIVHLKMERGNAARDVSLKSLRFVSTPEGWRADYQLPERNAQPPMAAPPAH
ncbi:energy transducer TonB [Archangium violaceum]|nr:energy transducer TonB [Archangium violaceum]